MQLRLDQPAGNFSVPYLAEKEFKSSHFGFANCDLPQGKITDYVFAAFLQHQITLVITCGCSCVIQKIRLGDYIFFGP